MAGDPRQAALVTRSTRKAKQLERLSKLRAHGPWHFILWHGVVGWGIGTAVLISLLMSWFAELSFVETLETALTGISHRDSVRASISALRGRVAVHDRLADRRGRPDASILCSDASERRMSARCGQTIPRVVG